jgi:hypothetical protein
MVFVLTAVLQRSEPEVILTVSISNSLNKLSDRCKSCSLIVPMSSSLAGFEGEGGGGGGGRRIDVGIRGLQACRRKESLVRLRAFLH